MAAWPAPGVADEPARSADRPWTRLLARAFSDNVDPARGLGEPDIRDPGPDTANYPNSPYTLPRGWNYLETSPVNLTAGINGRQAEIYNWNYLLRMGITDRVEFRLFGNGLVAAEAGLGKEATSGFAPLVFDTKIHFWDEHPGHLIPAAGLELYVQTPWGSPAFDQGTLPGATLLFRNTLPWDIEAGWNSTSADGSPSSVRPMPAPIRPDRQPPTTSAGPGRSD